MKNADHFVAISEATKRDIIELYNIQADKITKVYNGSNIEIEDEITKEEELKIKKKFKIENSGYIFFISTIEPRKNVATLIKAFNHIKENSDLKLIIAGGLGWKYGDVLKLYEASKYKDDIIMPGYISKKEKKYLFENARCFVYPSLYEGFGIPVLEAMANKAIVVTTNISSLPEVGGDAAIYFDNVLNYEELAEKIEIAINLTKEEKQEKIEKGLEQVKKFTWDKCAKETLEVIKNT